MSVGWIVVNFFSMYLSILFHKRVSGKRAEIPVALIVGFGMAEIVSAVPTSGGPYFWAAILAPPGQEAFASWITGWHVPKSYSIAWN